MLCGGLLGFGNSRLRSERSTRLHVRALRPCTGDVRTGARHRAATSASATLLLADTRATSRQALKLGPQVKQGLDVPRSEEHTSELQSLMRISYAAFCLKKKKHT